jgi:hypothetical protein
VLQRYWCAICRTRVHLPETKVIEDDIATCRRESVAQYEMGSRQREYIGADSDKQAEVLARVKAHEKLVQVREVDHHSAG